jgi:tellurite resistance protein TehA-like permease
MATGICSTALRDVGYRVPSEALLGFALIGFVVLFAALVWRAVRYRQCLLADLGAPEKAYAFFTFTAACNVLAARLLADGYRSPHPRPPGPTSTYRCQWHVVHLGGRHAVDVHHLGHARPAARHRR